MVLKAINNFWLHLIWNQILALDLLDPFKIEELRS